MLYERIYTCITCIPIHPLAGSQWSSLHWHGDKHCFPYHGYGQTISHWGPILPASHSTNARFIKPAKNAKYFSLEKVLFYP